jgi:hypothetical protein
MHEQFQSCIDACNQCATACDHCAVECITEASRELATCIRLDLDCAAACRLAAEVMGRGGPTAQQVCRLCADVCEACAEECDRHPMDHCRECAAACRACAQECRAMAR